MRKIIYYIIFMIIIIILLPLMIVKGCSKKTEDNELKYQETLMIKVYIASEKIIKEMPFEEYLMGVVAAEMPVEFEIEALKAQAVAARTYAFARIKKIYAPKDGMHSEADICTDSTHCQAWISKENAMKNWGDSSAEKNWQKIQKAVNETKNIIITYQELIANPVFHSNSGGRTENAEDVWEGTGVPYLKSVISYGEETTSEYRTVTDIKIKDFCAKLKNEYPDFKINEKDILKEIKILDYTEGGRVKTIKIGNISLKGTDFRKIFSLRSANFSIEKGEGDNLKITTIGNGHGVGMSQWGANYLAQHGYNYEQIIKYYYNGVELNNLELFTK